MNQRAETDRDHRQADGAQVDGGVVEDASPEIATIEEDIERTREDLARTVDQLAAKLDVRTRIRHRIAEARTDATRRWRMLRNRATHAGGKPTPTVMAVGGGLAAAMATAVAIAWWRRHSTPHRRARQRR